MGMYLEGLKRLKVFTPQGISVYMSTLTLTCIAVDRYIAIVHPFRPRMSNATAVTACLVSVNVCKSAY